MWQFQYITQNNHQILAQPATEQSIDIILSNSQLIPKRQQIRSLQSIHYNLLNIKDIIKYTLDAQPKKSYQFRNFIINLTIIFHRRLKLNKFVLFEAISIINRYINIEQIQNQQIILAITSLVISQKKINNKKFKIQKWLQLIQLNIPIQDILDSQRDILQKLDYCIDCYGNSLQIAFNITNYIEIDAYTFMFSRYLLELSFYLDLDYQGCQYLIAISCLKLSCHFLSPNIWKQNIIEQLGMSLESINQCCIKLFNIVLTAKDNVHIVYEKFKKSVYHQVSLMEFRYSIKSPLTPQTSSQQDISQKLTHTRTQKRLIVQK